MKICLFEVTVLSLLRVLKCSNPECCEQDSLCEQAPQRATSKESNQGCEETKKIELRNLLGSYLDKKNKFFDDVLENTQDIEILKDFDKTIIAIVARLETEFSEFLQNRSDDDLKDLRSLISELDEHKNTYFIFQQITSQKCESVFTEKLITFGVFQGILDEINLNYKKFALALMKKLSKSVEFLEEDRKVALEKGFDFLKEYSAGLENESYEAIDKQIENQKMRSLMEIFKIFKLKIKISAKNNPFKIKDLNEVNLGLGCFLKEHILLHRKLEQLVYSKLTTFETVEALFAGFKASHTNFGLFACSVFSLMRCTNEEIEDNVICRTFISELYPLDNLFTNLPGAENITRFLHFPCLSSKHNLPNFYKFISFLKDNFYFDSLFIEFYRILGVEKSKCNKIFEEFGMLENHISFSIYDKSDNINDSSQCVLSRIQVCSNANFFKKIIDQLADHLEVVKGDKVKKELENLYENYFNELSEGLTKEEKDNLPISLSDFLKAAPEELSQALLDRTFNSMPKLVIAELKKEFASLKPANNILREILNGKQKLDSFQETLRNTFKTLPLVLTKYSYSVDKLKNKKSNLLSKLKCNISISDKVKELTDMISETNEYLELMKSMEDQFSELYKSLVSSLVKYFKFSTRRNEIYQMKIESPYAPRINWCKNLLKELKTLCNDAKKAEARKMKHIARLEAKQQAEQDIDAATAEQNTEAGPSNPSTSSSAENKKKNRNECHGSIKSFITPKSNNKKPNKFANLNKQKKKKE